MYKQIQTFGKDGEKITLKSRQKDFTIPLTKTPGPGTYKDITSLPGNGRNFTSKYKSVNSGLINSKGAARFAEENRKKAETPGPGQYSPRTEFSKTGQYFLSHFKNMGTTALYRSRRQTLSELKGDKYSPGPGTYRLPSDFGYPDLNSGVKVRLHSRRSTSQL